MEYFGVTGLTISHANGSPITGGTFSITNPPSFNVKADGKNVYSGDLVVVFAGGLQGNQTVIGGGTISPTAKFCKVDGNKVIRKGDTGSLDGTATDPVSGATSSVSIDVEITDANQSVVKGA